MTTTGNWSTAWAGKGHFVDDMHVINRDQRRTTPEEAALARRRTTRLVTAAGGSATDLATVLEALGLTEETK